MTLNEKSQKILELPAVLELLAAEAVSDAAKEAALALTPSADTAEIERRLAETSAACELMTLYGSPSFSGIRNVTGSLRRADVGGMLNTRELLEIAGVLRAARAAASYATGDKAARSAISFLFSALRANKYLEDKITNSIVGDDELADTASPQLADIRRSMRAAGERVRQTLQRIVSSPSYAKVLQEPIITVKNGRYVVPVKAEHKNDVPGLTHDVSASGATLFIEPMSAVKANNEIRELLAKEEREIARILMELSAEAASFQEDIICDFNVLTQLDLVFAKAKLAYRLMASCPKISADGSVTLRRARHPLLKAGTAVPIDVRLGGDFDTLVITGPNTGGKTVSLKTIGLLCLMAECGLHIPADDGSAVPPFAKILADIGDEQSIEQSLSTFSSHMTNIVGILKECGPDTLILFDELGAGTDPAEGAALAVAIIEYARACGAHIAATTHYAELKIYAMTRKGVMNASCEFDVQTLRPTYRLLMGVPGKSNAFAISERLGLPREIIEDASARMDSGDKDFENALSSLEEARVDAEDKRAEAARLLEKAREDAKAAEKLRNETQGEREKAAKVARREAERILAQARTAADDAFRDIERTRKAQEDETDWQRLNEAKSAVRRSLNDAEEALLPGGGEREEAPAAPTRPAKAGDTVVILSIGTRAQVVSASPDGSLELQAGILKVNAKQDEVRVVEDAAPKKAPVVSATVQMASSGAVRPEIDLRGMAADEAVNAAERFIDMAQMRHLETVTLIHGKGTGVLRQAIQQALKRNPQVKSFRLGTFGEGESGVTIADLK